MRQDTKKILVGVIMVISLGVFGSVLARSVIFPGSDDAVPSQVLDQVASGPPAPNPRAFEPAPMPKRLEIPKLDIDAKIQYVGINAKGNMATPSNYTDVGWYKYGAVPGDVGSAVIAGHVNNGIALPAVFANLKKLVVGDEVYVVGEDGTRTRFVVRKIDVYDFDSKVESVFKEENARFLRLITCTGVYVPKIRTHDKRLVVTAERTES